MISPFRQLPSLPFHSFADCISLPRGLKSLSASEQSSVTIRIFMVAEPVCLLHGYPYIVASFSVVFLASDN